MNLAAIVQASENLDKFIEEQGPKIPDEDTIIAFTSRLITQALKDERWRIDLVLSADKKVIFDTGKPGLPIKFESKTIELTHDDKGIYLHSSTSIRSFYYSDLNFNYNNQLVQMIDWFHKEVLQKKDEFLLKSNQIKTIVQTLLINNGYDKYTVTIDKVYTIFKIYVSGNTDPVIFSISDQESFFTITHAASNKGFSVNYFELLDGDGSIDRALCEWIVGIVDNEINYEHTGYEILGFFQDQTEWFMSYRFTNQIGEFTHVIQAKRKESDLLKNLFPIFLHYTDLTPDSVARHETTELGMITYHQVLGLDNKATANAILSYSYAALNPLLHPDEVLHMALLEYIKPITDSIIKHI
jgi:hypothetical protein